MAREICFHFDLEKDGTFEICLLLCAKINIKAGNNKFQDLNNAPRKAIFKAVKNDKFLMKNCDFVLFYFCSKHISLVHVRTSTHDLCFKAKI